MTISAVDLFSGIGGFHAVASALGVDVVYACDSDPNCRIVYEENWGLRPSSDIRDEVSDTHNLVPRHDILFAGFPCQPFSKSGAQRGMEEARGTLFFNIAQVLKVRKPRLVMLENVRNLWSARHLDDWNTIIRILRDLGYRVSDEPLVSSPHRIPPELGGTPQVRERIFINATYVPRHLQASFDLSAPPISRVDSNQTFDPTLWQLKRFLPSLRNKGRQDLKLKVEEIRWLDVWNAFRLRTHSRDVSLPGHPLWLDVWTNHDDMKITPSMPPWKVRFIELNQDFYKRNRGILDSWISDFPDILDFPASRRKFEWQAGDQPSLWDGLIQLRPSGIRVKRPNYIPAAVAMTQTSVFGPKKRRLDVSELAQLQGLPPWFTFGGQSDRHSYKQLGNGIALGSAYQALLAHIRRDSSVLIRQGRRDLVDLAIKAAADPRAALA